MPIKLSPHKSIINNNWLFFISSQAKCSLIPNDKIDILNMKFDLNTNYFNNKQPAIVHQSLRNTTNFLELLIPDSRFTQ